MGPVEGITKTTDKGNVMHLFEAIPYGKAPVGELRFKPPQPMEPWDTPPNLPRYLSCVQMRGRYVSGQEDCLFVHVYTPVNGSSNDTPLSVMVYFHMGAFSIGTGTRYYNGNPDHFMDRNVIQVGVNYRLGPLGFLSTEDSECPGNYGMKDAVLALKWIRDNIHAFGGDPNSVTIFGSSSGAAIVNYLMLSPMAKGLFHRAISQSGTSIASWARSRKNLNYAQWLAERVGCPTNPKEELRSCLRKIDAEDMIYFSRLSVEEAYMSDLYMFSPRVDKESDEPFLPQSPMDIMLSGDYNRVPYILGYNKDEGMLLYKIEHPEEQHEQVYRLLKENYQLACHLMFRPNDHDMTEERASEACDQLRNLYIREDQRDDIYGKPYIDMIGDFQFKIPILKTASIMSSFHPVYLYSFDFVSDVIPHPYSFSSETGIDVLHGVNHLEESYFQFVTDYLNLNKPPDSDVTDLFVTAWTNFAKFGFPSFPDKKVNWTSVSPNADSHMSINIQPEIKPAKSKEYMHNLRKLFSQYWFKSDQEADDSNSFKKEEL